MTRDAHAAAARCPDAETIAALAEGQLDESVLDSVLTHVETCRSCMRELELANATVSRETNRAPSRPRWLAIAAAIAVIAIGAPIVWQRIVRQRVPAIGDFVELAPHSARLVEPRISGGFGYAPYRRSMRASSSFSETERLRLGGAAANAIDHADRDASAEAQHVAGVALLLAEDDPLKAVERLRVASERAPADARIANDLASARFTAAQTLGRASLYPEALAAVDQALRIDAHLAEALFNRALILERLGLTQEARRAWERYLAVDSSSPWAEEARRRMARLPTTSADALFRNELPRLERAAQRGDAGLVRQIVKAYPQQSRTFAEAEHLGRWGDATLRGDVAEAARLLTSARAIGDALSAQSHESLLRESVAAIDAADPARRARLAHAHQIYRQGRIAYARQQLDEAARSLSIAGVEFAAAGSPMAFLARYFAGSVAYARNEGPAARIALETVLREIESHRGYGALRAQLRWELALCAMADNDWSRAITLLTDAETSFEQLGERANLAFIRSMLATALMSAGRPDDAWAARVRAFEDMGAEGRGDRLLVGLTAASRMEQRAGRLDSARALLAVEVEEARIAANPSLFPDALLRSATVSEETGDHAAATRLSREALAASERISDASLRERAVANSRAGEGAILVADDPRRATDSLTTAIRFYQDAKLNAFLPAPYLYRARAALRMGKSDEALLDLERGVVEIERRPLQLPGSAAVSPVDDAGDALFDDAIRLSLDRANRELAFQYAERRRARAAFGVNAVHPPSISDLQQRLRGTATIVLHVTALPDEVVAFAAAENDAAVKRTRITRTRLVRVAAAAENGDAAALRELFDVLIRPCARLLEQREAMIVIADRRLERVPFAALYDASRRMHLVQYVSVAMASSAAALDNVETNAPREITAITLPSGERVATHALPEASGEAGEIAPLYARAHVIPAANASYASLHDALRHDAVVHVAGHTERQPGSDETILRFSGGDRATWSRIAADPLEQAMARNTIVVLAACDTLRGSTSPEVRSLSLGAAFAAAGAGNVIGTLTPIGDSDARELFLSIHRQLAAGISPAQALRRTQLEAIKNGRLPAWQSIALLTRCIHSRHANWRG